MKKFLCLLAALFLLAGCQVESPVTLDITAPTVTMVSLTNQTTGQQLIGSTYIEFGSTIGTEPHLVKIVAKDNAELYKVTLIAVGTDNKEYLLKEFSSFDQDTLLVTISSESFPAVQKGQLQNFRLFVKAQDITENSATSKIYGFQVGKIHPLERFATQLGNYTPAGALYEVNFGSKKDRLTFVHFHMLYCTSCKEEAEELQAFVYGAPMNPGIVSDTSKVYVASFGSHDDPEMNNEYILQFKRENNLTFDCFLDAAPELKVQHFMNNSYMPGDWLNGCIVFFPDGHFNQYNSITYPVFNDWLNAVYQEFLSAGNKNNGKGSK